jgi:hypothetical protein
MPPTVTTWSRLLPKNAGTPAALLVAAGVWYSEHQDMQQSIQDLTKQSTTQALAVARLEVKTDLLSVHVEHLLQNWRILNGNITNLYGFNSPGRR